LYIFAVQRAKFVKLIIYSFKMIYVKDVSQGQRYCYVLFFEKKSLSVIVFSRKLSSMYEKKKMKNSE